MEMKVQITNFQTRHPSIGMPSDDDAQLEEKVLEAIRSYHARRGGYYPKQVEDLRKDLDDDDLFSQLQQRIDVFQNADRRIRAEKQLSKKRKESE